MSETHLTMHTRSSAARLAAIAMVGVPLAIAPAIAADTTRLVSVATDGRQANDSSFSPSLSASGRSLTFYSKAKNLVSGDRDGRADVFVHDVRTGRTKLASVSSTGQKGNGFSGWPKFSGDGRAIAFESDATNLVPADTNAARDIFVRQRASETTLRVSVGTGGAQANEQSQGVAISYDGRYVTFTSYASNLVPGDTNGVNDVFVHDFVGGTTERVSVSNGGKQGPIGSDSGTVSADGRFVAFHSFAPNLVPNDTNEEPDIFVRDRSAAKTKRVSVASNGSQANDRSDWPAISADGRFVVFSSPATNLVAGDTNGATDVFVRDLQTNRTERVSIATSGAQANDDCIEAAVSADGRFVTFSSYATNLVPGDTNGSRDVFRRDRLAGTTVRVSLTASGGQANADSGEAAISADASMVVFESGATNLVPGYVGGFLNVFLRGPVSAVSPKP